jgi:energy-coupling factor transport system ATP-binding protein
MLLPEVSLEGVLFTYPGGVDVYPAPGLNLALAAGVTALVGENGAGKTTLTKLLIGLMRPREGRVIVAGRDVSQMTVAAMAGIVGYVFQNPDDQLFERTVKAEVGFGPRVLKRSPDVAERATAAALETCGLAGKEDVHPHDLSLPERKWVAIASALAVQPAIVVLDEPTLGQDDLSRRRLGALVEKLGAEGKLVLVVTHDMDFVGETCATTVILSRGRALYAGPTERAFEDVDLVKQAGIEAPHVTTLAREIGLSEAVNERGFLQLLGR